ncbi:MAG: class I SAM-dependent methyltransferase [Candidatus Latescibacteria bacterium]|nr:class I SAM-dependent methyltransferase [Candidatus Latescibacterota bacterium]
MLLKAYLIGRFDSVTNRENKISDIDLNHYAIIRNNVSKFLRICGGKYDKEGLLLDIAPQNHEGSKPYFTKSKIYTLDINPEAKADFTVDICATNEKLIPDNHFDFVVCTEVLEHTINPFSALNEIFRILKQGGLVFISVPFNFRIHGPLPDCWRFTVHGLKVLLKDFEIISLNEIETDDRWLMPIHYTVVAKKLKR